MKQRFFVSAIVIGSLFSLIGKSAESTAMKRVNYALDNIDKAYGRSEDYEKLMTLGRKIVPGTNEKLRAIIFRLESLFRMYGTMNKPVFDEPRDLVKELEDHIGHYDDAKDFYQAAKDAGLPEAEVKKRKEALDKEEKSYKKDLKKWSSSQGAPAIDTIRTAVTPVLGTLSDSDDRALLLTAFQKQIDTLKTKAYDLSLLEDGIHSLRRDLRWIEYYVNAMGGLVQWDATGTNAACPAEAVRAGWNRLTPPATVAVITPPAKICYIPQCLGARASTLQNQLSTIAYSAAVDAAAQGKDHNYTSEETRRAAQDLYATLQGTDGSPKLLDLLTKQIAGAGCK